MRNSGKGMDVVRQIIKEAYTNYCRDTYENYRNLNESSGFARNSKEEIDALIYFLFDFGLSNGPEIEIRTILRDYLLENVSKNNYELFSKRSEEYARELREGFSDNRMIKFGVKFSRNTGNTDDPRIVMWTNMVMKDSLDYIQKITQLILK